MTQDEMLPEYDFSQFQPGDRGKHAEALRQGYSVTVYHADGTSTTQHVPPNDSISETKLAVKRAGPDQRPSDRLN